MRGIDYHVLWYLQPQVYNRPSQKGISEQKPNHLTSIIQYFLFASNQKTKKCKLSIWNAFDHDMKALTDRHAHVSPE